MAQRAWWYELGCTAAHALSFLVAAVGAHLLRMVAAAWFGKAE